MTTLHEAGPPRPVDLPPLQEGRLYNADETSLYTNRKPLWLKRALCAGHIPGGRLGRKAVWSAQDIRDIVAQATGAPQKRPSRGGGNRTKQRPAA